MPASEKRRGAYTLLEILLAVVILMILTSLASSPLMRTWRDQRTGSAAEEVRALAAGSRIQALDRDETWQFLYEPGGTRYVRLPQVSADSSVTATDETGDKLSDAGNNGKASGFLPSEIAFGDSGGASTSTLNSSQLAGLPDSAELTGVTWSAPILFYSDGTSSDAAFEVTDEYGNSRSINVRELTGAVTVTDGQSLEVSGL